MEYEPGEDLSFEVELEVQPEIELERIGGFTVRRPPAEVGEDEVDSVLERLRDERGEWEPLPAGQKPRLGDQVMVEITALDDDGPAAGGRGGRAATASCWARGRRSRRWRPRS